MAISLSAHAQMFPKTPNPECVNFSKKLLNFELSNEQQVALNNSCKFNSGSFCMYEFTKGVSYVEYNDFNEIVALAKRCQYVRPRCVGVVKKYLDQSEYQSKKSMNQISEICIDTSYKCLDFECSNRKRSECDELLEIQALTPQCLR